MQTQRSRLYDTLLGLDYEDVIRSCAVNVETQIICNDPVFWEAKAQRDLGKSLSQVASREVIPPNEKYLLLRGQGIKEPQVFMSTEECLRHNVETGEQLNCKQVVATKQVIRDDDLIQAARDKEVFDNLVRQHNIDIYADVDLLLDILLEAIQNKNFPLLREISPKASRILTENDDIEEILNEGANTGDYELVYYLHDHFYYFDANEDVDEWILQAAITQGDEEFAEDLISELINEGNWEALIQAFIRSGDTGRLRGLVRYADFEGHEDLGRDILYQGVRYGQLDAVKLIAEDPIFGTARARYWFETAQNLAIKQGEVDLSRYLAGYLANLNRA